MTRIVLILAMTLALHLSARADTVGQSIPDFQGMMNRLIENRHTYNRYNDSIFIVHNKKKWVDFFFRRSSKNREIYHDNKKVLDALYGYFKQPEASIPDAAYDSLYKACQSYLGKDLSDPFITKKLSSVLLNHYKHTEGKIYKTARPAVWLSESYYNIYLMTKDSSTLATSYALHKYVTDSIHSSNPEYFGLKAYALSNLTAPIWFLNKLQTLDEYRGVYRQLRQLANDTLVAKLKIPQRTLNNWKASAMQEDENIVRNFYLADTSSINKEFGDSVLQVLIQRMDKDPKLNCRSKLRLLIMKVRAQCITKKEALRQALAYYEEERKKQTKTKYSDAELNNYMQHFVNLTYLNDIADIPERQKHKNSLYFCNEIVKAYKKRKDQQASTNYIKTLILLTTYPRLLDHLSEDERIAFLQKMIVNTQVTTYAHSVHVAKLAETLADGIITYAPRLFVGTLGLTSEKEVYQYKKEIKYFTRRAAQLHDLGKNDMISVVTNDYRPLSTAEREIIKTHPQMGLKYLAIAPSLAPFRDTTLGHHKWYNGKGGYPDNFDNTRSNKRIMIDVVTLCDCLQAATEKLGRNYKKTKSFDTVMAELREGADTRYNPELIKLIDNNEDVSAKMEKIAIDGWLDIYYDIHKRYFK